MTKDLRNFGILIGTVLAFLGGLHYYQSHSQAIYYLSLSLVFLLPALFYPKVLKIPYQIWMKLADILGFIMTRVILTVLFYLVLTPTALLLKLLKKDLLNLKLDSSAASYWIQKQKLDKDSLLKQY